MKVAKDRKHFDYKWIVIASCFLMVMVSLGFASSTKSLFPDEIAKELGTERSLVSIGESCRYIATAIVNVFFGVLIARFGAKTLIGAGVICLTSSMLLYAAADNLMLIYIAGTLLGIGFSWTTTTMVGYIVGLWCAENKGTIMGLVLASNGLGGAIAVQLVGSLIDPNVTGSYRNAYLLIAAVLASLFVILMIFFRNPPKDIEKATSSHTSKKRRGRDWTGIPFEAAIRKPYFWGALVCIFFTGLIIQGSHGIVAMHYKNVGIDYTAVKAFLSFGSLLLAGSKFLVGFLYDRGGLRLTVNICTATAILTTFLLAVIKGNETGFVLAIIYTVVSQIAVPLETVMLPLYASDLFGRASYSKFLGLFVSVNVAGYAVGAPLMNLSYDLLGSYVPALYLVGTVMIAVFILLQFVITAAHKEQMRIESTDILTQQEQIPERSAN